jgi:hypothetical protein
MDRQFYEPKYPSFKEAVRICIHRANKIVKAVALELWPDDEDRAPGRLNECLNEKSNQKLTMDEVVKIMKICGRYDPLFYMLDKLGLPRIEIDAPAIREHRDEENVVGMMQDLKDTFAKFEYVFEKHLNNDNQSDNLHILKRK